METKQKMEKILNEVSNLSKLEGDSDITNYLLEKIIHALLDIRQQINESIKTIWKLITWILLTWVLIGITNGLLLAILWQLHKII